ncbi:MAG: hypothetical protein SPL39_12175 [Selenomonadaceae bacterium]|nr:hypothetical protein [Selenomonadaceae bacterium]
METFEQSAHCVTDMVGRRYRLLNKLSSGGQGIVYRTQYPEYLVKIDIDQNKNIVAPSDERCREIEDIRTLPVDSALHVTMPLATLKDASGYVMRLMGDMVPFADAFDAGPETEAPFADEENPWLAGMGDYRELFTVFLRRGGLRRFLRAYLQAAVILARLHGAGLVYCDFSWNNVFVSNDPAFCHVWFIDIDNLAFPADCVDRPAPYTPGLGAPELFRGSSSTFAADVYAFAATMFKQLFQHRALEGQQYEALMNEEDVEEAEKVLEAGTFDWVFAEDGANAWKGGETLAPLLLSQELWTLFEATFVTGKEKPGKRPSMMEWSYGIAQALDHVAVCPHCHMDYYDEGSNECPWCSKTHSVLRVTSFTAAGKEVWRVAHEIVQDGTPARIPARIVEGFHADHAEQAAFDVRWTKQGLLIQTEGAMTLDGLAFSAGGRPAVRTRAFETQEHTCKATFRGALGGACAIVFSLEEDHDEA